MSTYNMDDSSSKNYYYNSTDDEDTEDDDPVLLRKASKHDEKLWDTFQDPPSDVSSGSIGEETKLLIFLIKLLKVFTYIIVFLVVLASSVLSKITFLLMTSHIKDNTKIRYCDIRMPEKEFVAVLPVEQIISWKWGIIFAFAVPEAGILLRAARICYFKNVRWFSWKEFGLVWLFETMHVLGLAILAFKVLPNIDVVKGVMLTNCLCLIPSLLCMLSRSSDEPKRILKYILDVGSIVAQLLGFFVWPLANSDQDLWFIPLAIFLISFRWWENYVSSMSPLRFVRSLSKMRAKLVESRYTLYLFMSPWKVMVFFGTCYIFSSNTIMDYFDNYSAGFSNHTIQINEVEPILSDLLPDLSAITSDLYNTEIESTKWIVYWILLAHAVSSYLCYIFSKFACKIHIQTFSFSFPINLTVPLSVTALIVICGLRESNTCAFHNILPDYVFFKMPPVHYLFDYVVNEFSWIWVLWLFAQTWVTRHLWNPNSDRNATTEKLFVAPMYVSLVIDQSLVMNRRRDDQEDFIKRMNKKPISLFESDPETLNEIDAKARAMASNQDGVTAKDHIPQVFVCATMWHENKEEMVEFLKSILRLDEDQCARRMAKKYIQIDPDEVDSQYYDLETHIFFDDAFVGNPNLCESPEATPINMFVHLLIDTIEEAAREVYKVRIKIPPPTKLVCPYGGRLVWKLPGNTKMIAHLKDKNKIRHKKRWSQVMYMYYLLGYRIMQLDASPERKRIIAQNTFLLALDGDIDFQPKAVSLLIDRMKVDDDLGAACGRIHPMGSGPMVWYQIFEYAIGHWLQKATEHQIGCVLCSPGCFSLFRGRALMENSVMKKYTTKSDQARHYVQYDQGEDRWLCTLLLKQKFRVEYSAASDAYTHAPEGFNEFYNQRRRWVPSTIANIFDLLADAKEVIKVNSSISMPYIIYQMMLMFGTILGPGTIFLMMTGSLVAVFQIGIYSAFLYNFVPLLAFMLICYFCKQKYQLLAAFVISIVYSLIMMAVMVGVIIQIMEDGILAPSSLFFITVALQIVITGLLHPQEMAALPAGLVYYITIPSMYMLLTIYSLFNLNDVSWGTRENIQDAAPAKANQPVVVNKTRLQKFLGYLRPANDEEEGSFDFSVAGLFRCMLCTHKKTDPTQEQLVHIAASLGELNSKLKELELKLTQDISVMRSDNEDDMDPEEIDDESQLLVDVPLDSEKKSHLLPDWLYDDALKKGETETISSAEEQFWTDLIEKYLKPLELTDAQKLTMKNQLGSLRDVSIFAFVMSNALFVLVLLLLQLNKHIINVRYPFNAVNTITFNKNSMEFYVKREYLELEPIGFMFVLFFGVVLVIQFIAMLFHRFATISQILATTPLDWYCSKKVKETVMASELGEYAVQIAMKLQKPRPEWDTENDDPNDKTGRTDTIHRLLFQHGKKQDWSNLETNFKRELFKDGELNLGKLAISKKTLSVLDDKRKSMTEYRKAKKSHLISSPNHYNSYGMANEGHYSVPNNWADDHDSISIYQRVPFRSASPNASIYGSTPRPLVSALKKSSSSLLKPENIYEEGKHNLGFVEDEIYGASKYKTVNKKVDYDGIELVEKKTLDDGNTSA